MSWWFHTIWMWLHQETHYCLLWLGHECKNGGLL
jgi:hypothetical protein